MPRIDPPRLDHWVEGLGPRKWDIQTPETDIIYEKNGLVPPRKLDPSDPFWMPGA